MFVFQMNSPYHCYPVALENFVFCEWGLRKRHSTKGHVLHDVVLFYLD